MKVVVDNSAGADGAFATEVAAGLRATGLDVELREPAPTAMFDTGVHLVSAGLAIRVPQRPERVDLERIRGVVRDALLRRSSPRRRMRSVPVYLAETERAIAWIDAIE